MKRSSIVGCLIGTAIGDALGLPFEGLRSCRAARLLGQPDRFRFLFGHGMMSDDTEHTCLVAEAMIESRGNVLTFRNGLARRLRWWLLKIPAGVGLATLKACLRLWIGIPPNKSGVFSAGNGPAMRSAILGACINEPLQLRELVQASSQITHSDPRAEAGALVVAVAALTSRSEEFVSAENFFRRLNTVRGDAIDDNSDLMKHLHRAAASVADGESTAEFAASIGQKGFVTGFVNHTVPVAFHAWLSYPDEWMKAVGSVIRCGGDADTTAAIVGGIVGCRTGVDGIPAHLMQSFVDWPRDLRWMEELADCLESSAGERESNPAQRINIPSTPATGTLVRNAIFLSVVLFHGFRRLLPPW